MTLAQLRSQTRIKLNELTDAFYTDDDISTALNGGYFELADATEFYEREAMIPAKALRTYHDLTSILPDTFLSPRHCFNLTTNRWLDPTDARELDGEYRQWVLVIGEPQRYFLRGNWWLGTFPKPTTDGLGYRFYYTAIPPCLADTDEPLFPREFHQGLVSFALCDLLSQQKETQKALRWWYGDPNSPTPSPNSYKDYESRLQLYVDGRTRLAGERVI